MNATVIFKQMIKPNLGILRFKADSIDFIPGQFYNIKLKSEELLMRPYSVCSTPEDDYLEFYIKAHEDGKVASKILELKEGDEVEILGPNGKFLLQNSSKEIYFICGGTGIAPIISMIRKSKRKITLLHGASHVDELGYFDELKEMETENFTYLPTVSREDWKGNKGRVETLLDNCTNSEAEVYICGPPEMVDEVKKELERKGFNNIFTEKYY